MQTLQRLYPTVRKRRDPAILDREELFLQWKIEEIFFSGNFVTLFQTLFQKLQIQVHVRSNKQTQNIIAYHY